MSEVRVLAHKQRQTIGLIAAWGRYPLVIAEALKASGHRVCCAAVRRHAAPELRELCDHFQWVGAARIGQVVRCFRRHGVQTATMAGKIHKVEMYQPLAWLRYTPDWTTIKTFYPHFVSRTADQRDDTLLGAIVEAFAARGIQLAPATDFAEDLLVKPGLIAGAPLSPSRQADAEFGWKMAKEMGRLDVGQSVCVKDRSVIAVEAVEGTDLCIQRAGKLCPKGGFTVVKVAKPQQDMRFDVPTVGRKTLASMLAAGATTLVIEADKTILLDETDFRAFARQHQISVLAINSSTAAAAA
ncbi:hypothetical protein Pla123a_24540 [Posidoniimonas polymericola]|uniref:UDP-2,3-diacylglucosamine pyrophosphatase LpxI n=1 Tax=Posidoniimonas polymericola TaxID=2528002 RepID=A0A5C5YQ51_9BACT|nr:UDP-2,3-diacylglucosamine diphosphatase LpxI [Posidoniimonas polymericola]TWT77026.1 hypothetical protein Pla123a_24540 [Posidoniimonas polymericola]